jgi:hypothetical protein
MRKIDLSAQRLLFLRTRYSGMMIVKPSLYRGIEFVCITDLPAEQQILLQSSPQFPERINILIEGEIKRNCIQYHAYVQWFQDVYKTSVAQAPAVKQIEPAKSDLVLQKA